MAWSLAMQTGKWSRYAELIRLCIPCNHDCLQVALLDVVPDCMPLPPESWKRRNSRGFTSVQKFHTHTHLLRTVIANFVVECILRAKALPLNLTGVGWWSDRPNCRKLPSPYSVTLQQQCWKCAGCKNRTGREVTSNWLKKVEIGWKTAGGSWVSHCPSQKFGMKLKQVRRSSVPDRYHRMSKPSSLAAELWHSLQPPAYSEPPKKQLQPQNRKLEVLHLFRWFTHTHTHAPLPRCFFGRFTAGRGSEWSKCQWNAGE